MDTPPLERAISAADGITKLAGLLSLKSHAVIHQWRLNRVPAEHCPSIERVTRAKAAEKGDPALVVTCEELRPDVAWGVLREQAAPEIEPAKAA
jgi:DNA-binding transcriptional regulator YdaS (Cro superfamily)